METRPAIAVVGMACRFPGAGDVDAYWRMLREGREGVRRFTEPELLAAGLNPDLVRRSDYVPAKGVLSGAHLFDWSFFGFSRAEAATIDPQQRAFLECASEAIDDAGIDPQRFPGWIGVYAGADTAWPADGPDLEPLARVIGREKDFLATRVAYKLGLRGPAITVQTACSTSLAAIHTAAQSLLAYECDAALAGGVAVTRSDQFGYLYQEGGILSRDGHCRPFDAAADGTVPSEGVGIVVLRRLEDAVHDGDRIVAMVRGSAMNNDGGEKIGYTAPSLTGQRDVIELAQRVAAVDPADVGYVEAHGTATRLGDPVEVQALTDAFRSSTEATGFCRLGSVKSNIGHTGAAAGVAGFIKTALILEHGVMVPTIHYGSPNPLLKLDATPFRVSDRARPWPDPGVRHAGVSSFGVGGTNVHVVLEAAPRLTRPPLHAAPRVFALSAKSSEGLDRLKGRLSDRLRSDPALRPDDVAWTMAAGRRRFARRLAVAADDVDQAATLLREAVPRTASNSTARVAFCFPGQGALRSAAVAAAAYRRLPGFRQHFDVVADEARRSCGIDLAPLSAAVTEPGWFTDTVHQQVGLLALGYGLGRQFEDWDVAPAALLGNSIGEYIAATVAGVWSLPDAVRVVAARARAMRDTPAGGMVAVAASISELGALLERHGQVEVAVEGPASTVLSGPGTAIQALLADADGAGFEIRRLDVGQAFHSAQMEPAAQAVREEMRAVPSSPPVIPLVSNLTGDWAGQDQLTDPDYWKAQLRHRVRLADGMATLLGSGCEVFIELGPGGSMLDGLRRHPAWRPAHLAVSPLGTGSETGLLNALGQLWSSGLDLPLEELTASDRPRRCALPPQPFQRRLPEQPAAVEDPPRRPEASAAAAQPIATDEGLRALLARYWRDALGVATVTDEADFFALGGDSMALVHLLSRLRTGAGVAVSPADLESLPTFGRLYALASRTTGRKPAPGPVELNSAGDGVPLFLAADASGMTIGYRTFAELLGGRRIYGLGPPAPEDRRPRIEDIAAHAVSTLRTARPSGPYLLGGWSFGAVVAHEMARQLLAAGDQVRTLVCIDGYVPNTLGLPMVVDRTIARDGLRLQAAAVLRRGPIGALVGTDPELRRLFTANIRAVWRYRPVPIECHAALFTASRSPASADRLRRRLAPLYRRGLTIRSVAGDHWSVLAHPHVKPLAEQVRSVLAAQSGDVPAGEPGDAYGGSAE